MYELLERLALFLLRFLIKKEKGRIEDGSALANIKRLLGFIKKDRPSVPLPKPTPEIKPVIGKKVLFITKKRIDSYGTIIGLYNSANFTSNALNLDNIDAKHVSVEDYNKIDREVWLYKPTHVVIEAIFVVPPKLEELAKKYPKIKWNVRIHSKLPFLANEGIAISTLKDYPHLSNVGISSNNKIGGKELSIALGRYIDYLPNIYSPLGEKPVIDKKIDTNVIKIGLFGALRPLKNHLLGAVTSIAFAEKTNKTLHLSINGNRLEQNGDNVLKNIRALFKDSKHELIEHNWVSHEEFLLLVGSQDLNLFPSLSESFCICAADSIFMEVPCIGSLDMAWMPKELLCNPCSIYDIFDKMKLAYFGTGVIETNKRYLKYYNQKSLNQWRYYLNA